MTKKNCRAVMKQYLWYQSWLASGWVIAKLPWVVQCVMNFRFLMLCQWWSILLHGQRGLIWTLIKSYDPSSKFKLQHAKSVTECYANLPLTFVAVSLSKWWQKAKGSEKGGNVPVNGHCKWKNKKTLLTMNFRYVGTQIVLLSLMCLCEACCWKYFSCKTLQK